MKTKIMIAGYQIEAHRKSLNDPAHVTVHKLGTEALSWLTPAEAQAMVPVFPAGADRSQPCPTCRESWGAHYGIACRPDDKHKPCTACDVPLGEHLKLVGCRGPGSKPTACAPGCQCGAHASTVPAPALVDGLDREVCIERWMENRMAIEGCAAPPNVLTPAQVAAGRSMWLARFGAQRSAVLRAKVAASAEDERNRVRVDIQDEP